MSPTPSTPNPSRRRGLLAAAAITAALAGPAVALASNGADDPAGHDATTTPTSTGATGATGAQATTRAQAIAAAQERVGVPTTVERVKRKQGHGPRAVAWEVRLRSAGARWTVRLDRRLAVLRVQRKRVHAPASTTSTTTTGSISAPARRPSGGADDPATHDASDDNGADDPATHDAGDDHGVDAPATHDAGDDHGGTSGSGTGSDDGSGHDAGDDHGGSGHGGDD